MSDKDSGRPGGLSSQATEPVPVSALRASIPDAVNVREIKRGIERLEKIRYRYPAEAIALLLELHDHLERALRIRIWNECKRNGMPDDVAYRRIKTEVGTIHAQAIEARRAETAKTGSVEDESAVAEGDAPNPRSREEGN